MITESITLTPIGDEAETGTPVPTADLEPPDPAVPKNPPAQPAPPAPLAHASTAVTAETPAPPTGTALTHSTPWPVSMALDPGVDWLRHAAKELHERFGLTHEAATLLPLSVLGSVTGPSVWIRGLEGLSVNPLLNTGWVVGPGSRFRDAQTMLHVVPMAQLRLARIASENVDHEAEKKRIAGYLKALSMLESNKRQAEAEYAAKVREWRILDPDVENKEVTRLEVKIRDVRRDIQEALLRLKPGLIVTDATLKELLSPSAMAFDGTVVDLRSGGDAVRHLQAATKAVRMDTSAMAQRVWEAQFRDETMCIPDHEGVSHQWTLSPADAGALMREGVLKSCGIAGSMLFVEASQDEPVSLSGGRLGDDALGGLESGRVLCMNRRLSGEPFLLALDGGAMNRFGEWIDDRSRRASRSGLAEPGIIGHLNPLALKIILLMHLAREGDQGVVGEGTVEAALHLADALIASDLKIRAELGGTRKHALHAGESEVELVYAKLRIRGPLTLRDLRRSFHRKQAAEVEKMVAAALDAGVVEQVDGRFVPIEAEVVEG